MNAIGIILSALLFFLTTFHVASVWAEESVVVMVMPNISTSVEMSSSDVNRIVCSTNIKDIIYSHDKGIEVKIIGNSAFIKYKIRKKGDKSFYTSTPSEFYVVCSDEVYSLVAHPKRIPPKTITLIPGRKASIRKNLALYSGLALEKKVVLLIKSMVRGEIPETFNVKRTNKSLKLFKNLDVTLTRVVTMEGEGLRAKEYFLRVKGNSGGMKEIQLKESFFLKKELANRPVGIALEKQSIKKGEFTKLFIVERISDEF